MTYSQAGLDALTDQAVTHIAAMRGDPGAAPAPLITAADEIATLLRAQFPGEPMLGRITVAVGQAAAGLANALDRLPGDQALMAVLNAVAFAGEGIVHERPGGGA